MMIRRKVCDSGSEEVRVVARRKRSHGHERVGSKEVALEEVAVGCSELLHLASLHLNISL